MKKAVILGERHAGLAEVPDPQPKEDWVVVKVHAAPMCTEYKGYVSGGTSEFLGHEARGRSRRCRTAREKSKRAIGWS